MSPYITSCNYLAPLIVCTNRGKFHIPGQGDYTTGPDCCPQHILGSRVSDEISTMDETLFDVGRCDILRKYVWRLLALAGLNILYRAGRQFVRRKLR